MTQYLNRFREALSQSGAAEGPAVRLRFRLWCLIGLVAALLVCHQLLLQPVLLRLGFDGPVINVAGRQRMLSQKLAKTALAFQAAQQSVEREQRRVELTAIAAEWSRAHRGLQQGDAELQLPAVTEPKILAAYRELDPHVQAILTATETLLAQTATGDLSAQRVARLSQSGQSASEIESIRTIMQHEEPFLTLMHHLVGLHAAHARARVWQLQALGWGIVGSILALLLTIQFLVIRPAVDVVGSRLALWEAQYRRLVESMSEGLVVFDTNGQIELVNRRFCELVELHVDDILGQQATRFITEANRVRYERLLANRHLHAAPLELSLLQASGGLVETMASIQSIPHARGHGEVFLMVCTDITERNQAKKKSRELLEQLTHADRLKSIGELIAELAHELNQPLAAIANYTEACLANLECDPVVVDELRTPLERILAAALRGGEIVRRARRFAQRKPHEVHEESINELVREVEQLCRDEAARRQVTIELELATDLPQVPVDGIQIQQVLANLIQNALLAMESTPINRRHLRITTQTETPDTIGVSVSDRGTGLKDADLCQLFNAFFTTRPGGLGLGLAIAQNIVEAHGGKIEACNNDALEGGATFHFTLPARTPFFDAAWSHSEEPVAHV